MQDFKGKTAVITGGATGIGFSLAKALGKEGARIIIAETREDRLQQSTQALSDAGVDAKYALCDVTQLEQVEALADFAWSSNGSVDMVFNNAGIGNPQAPVTDMPMEEVRAVFDVNFFGVWHGNRVFAKRLAEQGNPAGIYNTCSENGLFNAVPNHAAYVASKHAVLALTDSLREQVPDFIEVGCICPGWVKSEMMSEEMGRLAMDTDRFAAIVLEQIRAGQFFIVSHAYNMVRIQERYDEIGAAFAEYAPRYDGDEEYDIRTLLGNPGR